MASGSSKFWVKVLHGGTMKHPIHVKLGEDNDTKYTNKESTCTFHNIATFNTTIPTYVAVNTVPTSMSLLLHARRDGV